MTLTQAINRLPVRDQMAHYLVRLAAQAGSLADDPHEVVRRCYALSDAYLDAARPAWPGRSEANGDADEKPA